MESSHALGTPVVRCVDLGRLTSRVSDNRNCPLNVGHNCNNNGTTDSATSRGATDKREETKQNNNFLFFPFPFLFYYFVSIVSLVSLLFPLPLSAILLKNGAWHCLRAPEKLSHVDLLCVESVGKLIAHMLYRHWIYYMISLNIKVRNVSPTALALRLDCCAQLGPVKWP